MHDKRTALARDIRAQIDKVFGTKVFKTVITKSVRLEAVAEETSVKMTVSNDGDPISEPNREKIFDAFFTTRRDTGGTGMGLAIVQAVMTSHGGSIRLLPSDKGVAFELQFPAG